MLVSIVIPVFNVAPYLRKCLESLLSQSLEDWEAICVDDGSTDGSGLILDEYKMRDGRFVVVHQDNAGVCAARAKGLALARGEFVGWVDPDDWVDGDHFAALYSHAKASGADVVWSDFLVEDGGSTRVDQSCAEDPAVLLQAILAGRVGGSLWTKLLRRSAVIESGARFSSERLGIMEDVYFMVSFLVRKPVVSYVPVSTYHYVLRKNSLSSTATYQYWRGVVDAELEIQKIGCDSQCLEILDRRVRELKERLFTVQEAGDLFTKFYPHVWWVGDVKISFARKVLIFCAATGFFREARYVATVIKNIKNRIRRM